MCSEILILKIMAEQETETIKLIREHVGSYPDFPKPGVLFRDIFSILREPKIFVLLCGVLRDHIKSLPRVDCVVALDARGFLFGPLVALDLQIPFVPIRKKGKLPGRNTSLTYKLEYGEATVELQTDSIKKGSKVLVIDDLLATGGSLAAACKLLAMAGADVVECLVIIEISALNGRGKLQVPVHTILKY